MSYRIALYRGIPPSWIYPGAASGMNGWIFLFANRYLLHAERRYSINNHVAGYIPDINAEYTPDPIEWQ